MVRQGSRFRFPLEHMLHGALLQIEALQDNVVSIKKVKTLQHSLDLVTTLLNYYVCLNDRQIWRLILCSLDWMINYQFCEYNEANSHNTSKEIEREVAVTFLKNIILLLPLSSAMLNWELELIEQLCDSFLTLLGGDGQFREEH